MDTNNKKSDDMAPLSAEEIKAIGQIEIGPSKHEVFLNNHYKKLLWGGIALGLIGGGLIAYISHGNDRRDYAAAETVDAIKVSPVTGAVGPNMYHTQDLEDVRTAYADTPAAATAELLQGLQLMAAGDAANGVKILERVAANISKPELAARALAQLASNAMVSGDDTKAAQYWESVLRLPQSAYSPLACMSLGDIARATGDSEKARAYYEQAIRDYPSSLLVSDPTSGLSVELRRELLAVDYPLPVAPAPATPPVSSGQPSALPELPGLPDVGAATTPAAPSSSTTLPADLTAPVTPTPDLPSTLPTDANK